MIKKLPYFLLFLFILIAFLVFFGLYEAKFFTGRASVIQTDFSPDNSYIFIAPLRAKANNQETIRTTVFLLNNQGLGVGGKTVVLENPAHLTLSTIQGVTDSYGKAVFDVNSNQAGEYYLQVSVDGKALPQKAHLTFY